MLLNACHGIGGMIGRASPQCLPRRIVFRKICSVQMPMPLMVSGVKFAAYVTPQGPANAVLVALPAHTQSPCASTSGLISFTFCGCPESMRDMSGSGPWGPIVMGVWQSLQPVMDTRYRPRSTETLLDDA